jgi:hypothetical protein
MRQQKETGKLSLKRILACKRMRPVSCGHLLHLDPAAPFIAYVRFKNNAGDRSLNRAYKPVEFYELLNESGFSQVTIIQPYVHTRGSQINVYQSLQQKIDRERELANVQKIEKFVEHMQKLASTPGKIEEMILEK